MVTALKPIAAPSCHVPFLSTQKRPRVIIVGGGFAGMNVLHALKKSDAEVILIDKRNYHLFQPLLYQVATAALSPTQIAVPLRKAVEVQANCSVFLAEVTGVDPAQKKIQLGHQHQEYSYDYLVLATGAQTNYFGKDEWSAHAPGLKSIEEALNIRRRFLLAFEEAEMLNSVAERAELLTFVIVGGGPTGVELAGAMAEIAHTTLKCSFRRFNAATARVILVDSGERLLKAFEAPCSARAKKDLEALGVEVILGARVGEVTERSVSIKLAHGEPLVIATRQVIWAAGVKASELGAALGVPLDPGGRVKVNADLSVPGHPEVFVLGDLASYVDPVLNRPVPGVAQGAIQMGTFAGKIIENEILSSAELKRGSRTEVFNYNDKGSMATIGRGKAVATIGRWSFGGLFAWILWAVIHVFFLVGFRNRLGTLVQWVWTYFFFERGVRLITGTDDQFSKLSVPTDPRSLKGNTLPEIVNNEDISLVRGTI